MNDSILHLLLERLPLNIVWRLSGWNKRLNKLLLSEYLWRRKCEREFDVLHTRIDNYRIYYLIRSDNCYGKVYKRDYKDVLVQHYTQYKRVKYVQHDVLLNEDTLYTIEEENATPLLSDVSYKRGRLLVQKRDGKEYHIDLVRERKEHKDKKGRSPTFTYETTIAVATTDGTTWESPEGHLKVRFDRNGVLTISRGHEQVTKIEEVVDFVCFREHLFTLRCTGAYECYEFKLPDVVKMTGDLPGPYIKIIHSNDEDPPDLVALSGITREVYNNSEFGDFIKFRLPIRYYTRIYKEWHDEYHILVTAINGRCYYIDLSELTLRSTEYQLRGIMFNDGKIIATSLQPSTLDL